MTFEELPLSDNLLDALYDMRFEECTPIQAQCIEPVCQGRDLIGIAQTGTGKTAAYLLPLLTLLEEHPHPTDAVNCLVMAPTRELARQIDQALQGFAYYTGVNSVAVYGGNDGIRYEQERKALQGGADIVIATPGRLITHLQLGSLSLARTTHFVLDEADRMLDMGFSEDIMKIASELPEQHQTILFSATMPPKIEQLAKSLMHDPVVVKIAVAAPAEGIDQSVYLCRSTDKFRILQSIFADKKPERTIIFSGSKLKVKELQISLARAGFNATAMHSDLDQSERDSVMQRFRAGHIDLLVATDIVARGIDIDDIQMVINFDAPRDAEDYVHRIGRTARAGKDGRAVTLVDEQDLPALDSIEHLLGKPVPRAAMPEGIEPLDIEAARKSTKRFGRGAHGGRSRSGEQKSRSSERGGRHSSSHKNDASTPVAGNKPAGRGRHRGPQNGRGRGGNKNPRKEE